MPDSAALVKEKLNKEEFFAEIAHYCKELLPDEMIKVLNFGKNRDLILEIFKDEDYDPEKDVWNHVYIHTQRRMGEQLVSVDNGEAYVTRPIPAFAQLECELDRIWNHQNFETY